MRNFFLQLLFYSGFFKLWLYLRPKSVTFIMLHGVMDEMDSSAQWQPFRSYLSRQCLDAALKILTRYYKFISIDEALEKLSAETTLDRHYCVLTLDDGQKNNLTHAMPTLRRHSVPAVMYVVPRQIERQEPYWFDRLDFAIQHAVDKIDSIRVFDKSIPVNNVNRGNYKALFLRLKSAIFNSHHTHEQATKELYRLINELEQASGRSLLEIYPDDPWSKLMSWEDIKQAALSSDITIGSHTLDHSLLGKVSEEEINTQLAESKREIEAHTQQPCVHFCYPDGSIPLNPDKHLQACGYSSAVTTKPGITFQKNFDRYQIKRYHIPVYGDAIFNLALISGFVQFIKKYIKVPLFKQQEYTNAKHGI
jgi:peptidoglycan/xylan/chitin deacetylase (PgdA/CDA1 family)